MRALATVLRSRNDLACGQSSRAVLGCIRRPVASLARESGVEVGRALGRRRQDDLLISRMELLWLPG